MLTNLAQTLGTALRETVPDTTWARLPDRMVRLLVEIEQVEARSQDEIGLVPARAEFPRDIISF